MPKITEPRIGADPEIGVSDAVPGEDGTIRQHGELRRGTAAVGRCAAGGPAINVKVIPAAVGTQKPGGAIARGYGEGLIKYREWLYKNISAKALIAKKRDYFTPEEIEILLVETKKNPNFINGLKKNVPKNADEIKKRQTDL